MLYRVVFKNKLVHITLVLHVCMFEVFVKIAANNILAILLVELFIFSRVFDWQSLMISTH